MVQGGGEASRIQQLTRTIPIVTSTAGDLVALGLAESLTRPDGDVTGIQTLQIELVQKHLALLKDLIPRLSRSGVLAHNSNSPFLRAAEAGGKVMGIAIQSIAVQDANEFEDAFAAFHAERAQGIVIIQDAFLCGHSKTLAALALRQRLPTISDIPILATQGGLMSYGYNVADAARSAADIVVKILGGVKASEIPIQQAATFQLVINLKTAKALGLTIPPSLLARADQVIE